PWAAGTPAASEKNGVPVAPVGVVPVACTALTAVASFVATWSYDAEASARAPPVPFAVTGARSERFPPIEPPDSDTVPAVPDVPGVAVRDRVGAWSEAIGVDLAKHGTESDADTIK
ncbi:hypothetical protein IAE22_32790, partial [Bacillus sp. S34]|nr:hypothetical protein [Bacillus sp. S34]